MAGRKQAHLNEEIRHKLSLLLLKEISDPRLEGVTITAVQVAKDLSTAQVRFSCYRAEADRKELTAALNHAAGFLGRALGRTLGTRRTPRLQFRYDPGFDYAQEIEESLKSLEIQERETPPTDSDDSSDA